MQDATPQLTKSSGSRRGTLIVSGTLLVVLAGAIGMQVYRARDTQAAEQGGQESAIRPVSSAAMQKPVGRVNGQSITYEQLAQECILRDGSSVLEQVINRVLIQQACAESGIVVSDAEVATEIQRISKKFGLPVDQWQKMLQAERGLSPIQYRRDVIWPMLALKKLAGEEVKITAKMMQDAYEDSYGPRVKARMIVLGNVRRATEIWEKAKANPDAFEDLARNYSVEPNSKALGGTVPPIRKNSGAHPEIRKAAFKMTTPGQICSGPIQVDVGRYVLLKYEGRTDPVDHNKDEVKQELFADLQEREVQRLVGETFKSLKDKARVDNYLTGESKTPVEQTASYDDIPSFE